MRTLIRASAIVVLVVLTNLVTDGFKDSVRAGDTPDCVATDMNGDGSVSVADAVYFLNFLFTDGPNPEACAGDGDSQFTEEEADVLRDLAQYVSVIDVEDPDDDEITYKTIRFEEVNVQIVNGLGATNGYPDDPFSGDESTHEILL